jgi:hypothetical protein
MDLPCFEFGTVHSTCEGFQYQHTQMDLKRIISTKALDRSAWMCRLACASNNNGDKGLLFLSSLIISNSLLILLIVYT